MHYQGAEEAGSAAISMPAWVRWRLVREEIERDDKLGGDHEGTARGGHVVYRVFLNSRSALLPWPSGTIPLIFVYFPLC